ncbi:hypothetical protein L3X38_001670 [Prunus dulcis]|uniref:Uncharacterized protein n=1 Tax=Prunus dulcis TaxID=3755 RepID=A0AAD4WSH4_PRUDU|nr:hypothetical protein L3X38_001670 [Prunus dulcis]
MEGKARGLKAMVFKAWKEGKAWSPLVGRIVPGHIVVEDSSVWFSQTILSGIVSPVHDVHYDMYLPDTWTLGYVRTWAPLARCFIDP